MQTTEPIKSIQFIHKMIVNVEHCATLKPPKMSDN